MVFYILTGKINTLIETENKSFDEIRTINGKYRKLADSFYHDNSEKMYLAVSSIDKYDLTAAVLVYDIKVSEDEILSSVPLDALELERESVKIREIDSSRFNDLLIEAYNSHFIVNTRTVYERTKLKWLFGRRDNGIFGDISGYSEKLADNEIYHDDLCSAARKITWDDALIPEFDRIRTLPTIKDCKSIPVHYVLCGNDNKAREKATELLVSALYRNGRVFQRRYCELLVSSLDPDDVRKLQELFECSVGGTIVFHFRREAGEEGSMRMRTDAVSDICHLINDYKNKVQTILCFPLACEKEKVMFFEKLPDISMVIMEEGSVEYEKASEYLVERAKSENYTTFDGLVERLKPGRKYRFLELNNMYEEWSAKYVRTVVYPQYSHISTLGKTTITEKPKGMAYEKLGKMIGLAEAKKVVDNVINYYKLQKIMQMRNRCTDKVSMHMVFTGNPGTAKTTVARLFAEILRDNDILASGHLVEVGRGDLVGRYVGQTAPLVQRRFKEATGGVLFIDEAYSLVDDKDGLFGDEAINMIVQEMENNRHDLVVIFAGYPDKMKGFLNKNPGLRSRIAFHVPFADYSVDELADITSIMAEERQLVLDVGAVERLKTIYKLVCKTSDFGNGRFVRNLLEKASMNQASRLVGRGFDRISDDDLVLLKAEDFEYEEPEKKQTQRIGFSCRNEI